MDAQDKICLAKLTREPNDGGKYIKPDNFRLVELPYGMATAVTTIFKRWPRSHESEAKERS